MQQADRNLYHGRKSGPNRKRIGFLPRIQWLVSSLSIIVILLYIFVYRMMFHPSGKHYLAGMNKEAELLAPGVAGGLKNRLSRSGLPDTRSLPNPGHSDHASKPNHLGKINANPEGDVTEDNRKNQELKIDGGESGQSIKDPGLKSYDFWRELAVSLAGQAPDEVLKVLEDNDPFGVRTFERKLLNAESTRGAFLDRADLVELFPCPPEDKRITVPDQRDETKARAFRDESDAIQSGSSVGETETFLFFQHLRKAGGTNFCSLAEHNLPKRNLPPYYCMPDYHWTHDTGKTQACAGCASHWTNDEITSRMRSGHHRIYGNEWDAFDSTRFFELPALFATSFRRPLDRALSQFRFECIEDRGCKIKVIEEWWKKRTDLTNVYTWTFSKRPIYRITMGTTQADSEARKKALASALDTVAKFNLVMAMEWLAYAPKHVTDVLGFSDTTAMTTRVRPHIANFHRDDGQEKNNLGAAGITKASWNPKDYLSAEQYKIMSEDLALDEILTDAARRMFLERLVCDTE